MRETLPAVIEWLLQSDEPWTRYRTLVDLLGRSEEEAEVQAARAAMVGHSQVQALAAAAAGWPSGAIKRHNDAGHALHKLSTLADFGLRAGDSGIDAVLDAVLAHQSAEGAFQSVLNIAPAFGGSGQDQWTWVLCDTPVLLYVLLAMGRGGDPRVQQALDHLVGVVADNGYRCLAAPELGKFHGPGRRSDPCPIANVYALKALAAGGGAGGLDDSAARLGAEVLLGHWQRQADVKIYLFGVGTDYRKLKYPFIWYDLLHVADALSRFSFVHGDLRFQEMLATIEAQADGQGRYTASSMYQAWKGWSFADKKAPSPWLTFLVLRLRARGAPAKPLTRDL